MYHIYTIQNKINLKIYVGKSEDPPDRWGRHKKAALYVLRGKSPKNVQVVQKAMAKYGIKNFEFQVIEDWETLEEVNEAEQFWIQFLRSRTFQHGYNVTPGGDGCGSGKDHPSYGKPAPNRIFSDEKEKEICDMYKTGKYTIIDIGEKYDCHFAFINGLLRRNDVEVLGNAHFSKGKHYSPETEFKKGQASIHRIFSDKEEEKICKMYLDQKLSTTQISEKFNCHRTVIIRLLNRHNIQMRNAGFYAKGRLPPNKLFTEEQEKQICKEYKTAKSITEVANKWKCDRSVIADTLSKHNVPVKKAIRKSKYTLEYKKKILETYNRLGSAAKTAEYYGMCRKQVSEIKKELA